jgi:hypothetical protein
MISSRMHGLKTRATLRLLLVCSGTGFELSSAMRSTLAIFIVSLLVGCAARPKQESAQTLDKPHYEPRVSTALAFDPPIAMNDEPVVLARNEREPYAIVGYDQTTTTVFNIYYNDTQYGPTALPSLWFQRQAISERFGVSFR